MRTRERLLALKSWAYETLCEGRQMKAPSTTNDITEIIRQEPQVYLGWWPSTVDPQGLITADPIKVCPGILIMPTAAHAKKAEEKNYDKYNGIHRVNELAQWLNVTILFSLWEPGIRHPGFVTKSSDGQTEFDISKLEEGTEEGLLTLTDWMDDCINALIAQKTIPNSDLFLDETSVTYSPYTDQEYVVDKRPLYYGFVNAKFQCYSEGKASNVIDKLLN